MQLKEHFITIQVQLSYCPDIDLLPFHKNKVLIYNLAGTKKTIYLEYICKMYYEES